MVTYLLFIFFRDWKNVLFGAIFASLLGFLWQRAEIIEYGVSKQFWFHDIIFVVLVVSVIINFMLISYLMDLYNRGKKINADKDNETQ